MKKTNCFAPFTMRLKVVGATWQPKIYKAPKVSPLTFEMRIFTDIWTAQNEYHVFTKPRSLLGSSFIKFELLGTEEEFAI